METVGLCDSRQPANVKQGLVNLGWEETALKAGDYQFRNGGKTFGIESKTTGDLVSSFTKKASSGLTVLQDELVRLREAVDVPILLILDGLPEITWDGYIVRPDRISPVPWDALANFLTTTYISGIIPVFGTSKREVSRVEAIRRYFCKLNHTALTELPVLKFRQNPKPLALMGVPGVSKKLAQIIYNECGSLGHIAEMGEVELRAVPGVGAVLAKNIWDYFR